ncbi:6-phosphogluconolactonase [Ruegeria pomeroyi]|uniref:6-phosphogluconolactonase n=2 Tax=Ruegeria pomeroyi TaxID=89184 RepID=Q5LRS8_RUEPO|nr:6-phosphogluconolactonase [Ruegeria pomeroyi]AAV95318.1 6-phosphogluconolactonase [Ruegeria pomeroyi DSS-3]NVK95347.1 6-phosphogluconolactonase [Ruegeria pomeroyi]NVL03718.1 6-phosphogluconolactonase [Ruegeria pomeroyi]QWV08886.1 6-phosphogluconolactonase [Ruegeria pomeroyi]
MNIQDYPDRDMLAIDLANHLAGELEATLFTHDSATLAVAGGTTPGPVFDVLCAADLDWHRVMVLPTDERCVPQDHSRANARLIAERLLVNRAASARYLPLYLPGAEPEDCLAEVEALLTPALPLSVLVLGMGEDMHTASLFAGMPGLAAALDADAPALAVARPETQPENRITLTAPVLNGALSKHLIIYGAAKRKALERAMSMHPEEAPIAAVLDGITVHWAE